MNLKKLDKAADHFASFLKKAKPYLSEYISDASQALTFLNK